MTKVDDDYKPRSNYHSGSKERNCYFCNCGPPLREHHIIPQRFDGPDTKDNTVEVCDLCHKRLERLYDKSFYEWFGIADEKGKREFHRPCFYREINNCGNQAQIKVNWNKLNGRGDGKKLLCVECALDRAADRLERVKQSRYAHLPEELTNSTEVVLSPHIVKYATIAKATELSEIEE